MAKPPLAPGLSGTLALAIKRKAQLFKAPVCPTSVRTHTGSFFLQSQTFAVMSRLTVQICAVSDENAQEPTASAWPSSVEMHSPVDAFHTRQVLSLLVVAICRPLEEKTHESATSVWPVSVRTRLPVTASYNLQLFLVEEVVLEK